jgi:hypothetical protein
MPAIGIDSDTGLEYWIRPEYVDNGGGGGDKDPREKKPEATSGEGGGGGGGGGDEPREGFDWRIWLADWGFDAAIVNELDRIFRSATDPNMAAQQALAYIRGTDWYARTFPGINEAKRLGIIGDERDYRAYLNQANQLYRQWMNRDIATDEFVQILTSGTSLGVVAKRFEGAAYVGANRDDIQYLAGNFGDGAFTDADLKAYGEQQVGLGSTLGAGLQAKVQNALMRLNRVFQGQLATPSLSLGSQGLNAPSLNPNQSLDIGR